MLLRNFNVARAKKLKNNPNWNQRTPWSQLIQYGRYWDVTYYRTSKLPNTHKNLIKSILTSKKFYIMHRKPLYICV